MCSRGGGGGEGRFRCRLRRPEGVRREGFRGMVGAGTSDCDCASPPVEEAEEESAIVVWRAKVMVVVGLGIVEGCELGGSIVAPGDVVCGGDS